MATVFSNWISWRIPLFYLLCVIKVYSQCVVGQSLSISKEKIWMDKFLCAKFSHFRASLGGHVPVISYLLDQVKNIPKNTIVSSLISALITATNDSSVREHNCTLRQTPTPPPLWCVQSSGASMTLSNFSWPAVSDESYGYQLADSSSCSCGMCWHWNCGLDSGGMKTIMFMDIY